MILTSAVDVITGAGNPWYDNNGQPRTSPSTSNYVGGQPTWGALVARTAGADADGDWASRCLDADSGPGAVPGLDRRRHTQTVDRRLPRRTKPFSSATAATQYEESIDFERAVEAVIDWVQTNSNWGETLLIVTGDHETGYLTGPGSAPLWMPIVNNGRGNLPGTEWHSPNHTNSLMFLSAKGDAGWLFHKYTTHTDPVRGPYVDNTNVAHVMFEALGWE